jgi:hypothetical protein
MRALGVLSACVICSLAAVGGAFVALSAGPPPRRSLQRTSLPFATWGCARWCKPTRAGHCDDASCHRCDWCVCGAEGPCESWCGGHTASWAQKCAEYAACSSCIACCTPPPAAVPLPSSPTPSPTRSLAPPAPASATLLDDPSRPHTAAPPSPHAPSPGPRHPAVPPARPSHARVPPPPSTSEEGAAHEGSASLTAAGDPRRGPADPAAPAPLLHAALAAACALLAMAACAAARLYRGRLDRLARCHALVRAFFRGGAPKPAGAPRGLAPARDPAAVSVAADAADLALTAPTGDGSATWRADGLTMFAVPLASFELEGETSPATGTMTVPLDSFLLDETDQGSVVQMR